MKFEWNTANEKRNIQKHGVTFEQALYVFADPFALSKYDDEHSDTEERWVMLGKSINQVILVVAHMFRNSENIELVRIISVEKQLKKSKKHIKIGVQNER